MTADDARPNFYTILGLDPDAPWNDASFSRTLTDKRNEWSRQATTGIKTSPATVTAKRNLGLIRGIEAQMRDPASRESQRQKARELAASQQAAERDKLAADLDLMLAKGYLWDVEVERLRRDHLGVLTANPDLARKVDKARHESRAQPGDPVRLPAVTERNIRSNLRIVGQADLYAVLRDVAPDVSERTARPQLLAAAEALYQKAQRNPNKQRPEVGAAQQLAGLAQQVFGSDDQRERHDTSMRLFPLDDLLARYEQALGAARAIDSRQAERFLREAVSAGIGLDEARQALAAHFRGKNWPVDLPSSAAEERLRAEVRCPHCGHLNDPGNAYCADCSRPLRESCPACDAVLPLAARACPRCGFPVIERAYAGYLADEAEASLERGDLVAAADLIGRWESAWPVPAGRPEPLADRARRARERLAALLADLGDKAGQATALMDERRYHDALRQLRGLPFRPPGVAALIERCEAAIGEASRLCREARAPGVPDERRALLYSEALHACADHAAARDGLALIPPPPPRRLRAEPDLARKVVRLTWEAVPGLSYSSVIFRSPRPLADSAPDGQYRRAVVRGRGEWEDNAPPAGVPLWYAVFTERDGATALSAHGAVTSPAVVLTADPELTLLPGDGQVRISWRLPENAGGIELTRAEVGPGGAVVPGTAIPLPLPAPGTRFLADADVRNGVTYRYVARATFGSGGHAGQGGQGAGQRSPGTTRDVTPAARPQPPGAVAVRGYAPPPGVAVYLHRVELRWPQGPDGIVKVIRTVPEGVALPGGDDFPEAALHSSQLVIEPDQGGDYWFTGLSLCTYTPVLFLNGRCYPGEPRHYALGPEVAGLLAEAGAAAADASGAAGALVAVTWTWPDAADAAVVAWDSPAGPFDPVAAPGHVRVARSPGQRAGRLDVPADDPHRLVLRVAAVRRAGGLDYVTSGLSVSATASVRPPAPAAAAAGDSGDKAGPGGEQAPRPRRGLLRPRGRGEPRRLGLLLEQVDVQLDGRHRAAAPELPRHRDAKQRALGVHPPQDGPHLAVELPPLAGVDVPAPEEHDQSRLAPAELGVAADRLPDRGGRDAAGVDRQLDVHVAELEGGHRDPGRTRLGGRGGRRRRVRLRLGRRKRDAYGGRQQEHRRDRQQQVGEQPAGDAELRVPGLPAPPAPAPVARRHR
ncbi:MAG TPA: zinc ribbon domain-containing protein [Trebonia sp.]|jgi:hypothetical protein|nr:zinc ribbon domain-containing protein [Trebonia sp.]